ncbi:uncharacterized protein LOC142337073 isoform X2 [Convolutriloba macropyga]|uniref:uncharacterized protein LOC142337073 isoform X2 n=1 Tax=Convolutriloba macropyga TaxID=536237 RepID=UPI003F526E9D
MLRMIVKDVNWELEGSKNSAEITSDSNKNPDKMRPEHEDQKNLGEYVRRLTSHQLLNLLKRHYISCDDFQDCNQELKRELLALRRRNKLRLLDQIRNDHNSMYLKLTKDRMGPGHSRSVQ